MIIYEDLSKWCQENSFFIDDKEGRVIIPPIALEPCTINLNQLDEIAHNQKIINLLYHQLIPTQFIDSVLDTLYHDQFIRQLHEIWKSTRNLHKPFAMSIFRADYLPSRKHGNKLKQVEINTFSVAFMRLGSTLIPRLHRSIFSNHKVLTDTDFLTQYTPPPDSPNQRTVDLLNKGFDHVVNKFNIHYNIEKSERLMIVLDNERNVYDQGTGFIRLSLPKALPKLRILDRHLLYDDQIVSVVYMRAGYSPDHYVDSTCFQTLELIACSTAIMIPSLKVMLSGFKKIHQRLADPLFLKNIIGENFSSIINTSVNMYDIDDTTIDLVLGSPADTFVLKPQREGGGNNYFGEKLKSFVRENQNNKQLLSTFSLMDRIHSEPTSNRFLINSEVSQPTPCISEIGIYGLIITEEDADGAPILIINQPIGYLVRTKPATEDEGGVMAGSSALNSLVTIK